MQNNFFLPIAGAHCWGRVYTCILGRMSKASRELLEDIKGNLF